MPPILVRDLRGRAVGYLEADRLRDENAKPIAERVAGDGKSAGVFAKNAARLMSGRPVLMDLAIGDVATAATQASFGLPVTDFVADKVSTVRYVKHDRGIWYPENAADAIELVLPTVSSDASPPETAPVFTSSTFTTTGYALAVRIPRQVRANADFDVEYRALRRVVEGLRLAREMRVAKLLTTATNYATANRIAAFAKWNGGVSANPLGDLFNGLLASFLPVNMMILAENVAQFFYVQPQASTGIRDYVQAGGEMPDRVYARGKSLVGGTPTYIWAPALPANVALVRTDGDQDTIPTSVTLRWIGQGPDGDVIDGILVRRFFDSKTDSDWIVCAHHDAEVMVSNNVGAIITGALA